MTLIDSKELWNCLHHSDRMTGSEGEERRTKILETLSRASKDGKEVRGGGTRSRPQKPSRDPLELASTHRLVEGQHIGCTYDKVISTPSRSRYATDSNYYHILLILNSWETPNLNEPVPIWKWMETIRTGEVPVASFYFPDNLAGPDILFSLESAIPDSGDRIICILQVSLTLGEEHSRLGPY